jgi:hypothetical protein
LYSLADPAADHPLLAALQHAASLPALLLSLDWQQAGASSLLTLLMLETDQTTHLSPAARVLGSSQLSVPPNTPAARPAPPQPCACAPAAHLGWLAHAYQPTARWQHLLLLLPLLHLQQSWVHLLLMRQSERLWVCLQARDRGMCQAVMWRKHGISNRIRN